MNGLLVLDKPSGMSSHDVVARARRALREKRVGHAGTLDPLATGVLVLCVGHATRLSEYLLGEDKAYEGLIKLGERTDTDDAEGQVIDVRPVPALTPQDLRALEARFTGEIAQCHRSSAPSRRTASGLMPWPAAASLWRSNPGGCGLTCCGWRLPKARRLALACVLRPL